VPVSGIDSASRQALVFQRLRWNQLRNGARQFFRASPIRLFTLVLCSVLICGGVFAAAAGGFSFLLRQEVPFAGRIVGLLFDLLFLSLAVMLIFSSGIILYSSLFASAETGFLLATPATADQVFAHKFQGAVAFSSWAFLLLGGPVLLAYGVVYNVPWPFYALLPLFVLGFVLLPGSIGALLCLVIVNSLPRRRKQVLVLGAVAVLAGAGFFIAQALLALSNEHINRNFVQQFTGQLQFAQGTLVPSHWMTRGLQAAARGDRGEALFRLALVWSNGLFLYVLTAWTARRLYRRGYNRIATGAAIRKRYGGAWLDRALNAVLWFLDPQTRHLIVKDFRTFRRDPAQWAQVVIFCGLLTLYFANTRRFYRDDASQPYQNGISLLNLASTALLLCAYTGRFIYPLLSLEGRKFWVLGLLPLQRDRLLWGKFAFSATGALLIAEFLVVISDLSLGMPALVMGLHALTVAVLAVGLSGLSVGLGALLPNFRESDPSKIAVGFGGTLNLLASLLFLIVALCLMALPWHVAAFSGEDMAEIGITAWQTAGVAAGLVLGVVATVLPLRLGCRALRRMEF